MFLDSEIAKEICVQTCKSLSPYLLRCKRKHRCYPQAIITKLWGLKNLFSLKTDDSLDKDDKYLLTFEVLKIQLGLTFWSCSLSRC